MVVENQNTHDQKEHYIRLIETQKNIFNRYIDIQRISKNAGDGCFSLVFSARDTLNKGEEVALKFYDPSLIGDSYRLKCFHREAEILQDLRDQKNILPLVQEKTDLHLSLKTKEGYLFPLHLIFYSSKLAKFNIADYIYNQKTNYLINILFFREICKAVQRIHKKGIMHRDLKPGNFLVYNKKYVCLSDFGTARYSTSQLLHIRDHYVMPVGDVRYTALEIWCGLHFSDDFNFLADFYSLGTILFELFAKTTLNTNIFNTRELVEMSLTFNKFAEYDRKKYFDSIIGGFSKNRKLPSIREYDNNIPKTIANEVDRLYRSLACLDYRRRQIDFKRIFNRINICEKVIKYYKKIEKMKKKKEDRLCKILPLKNKVKRD